MLPVPGRVIPVLLIGKDSMRSSDEASVVTVPPNLPSFAEPCHTADERLFNQILSNSLTKHMCSTIFFHRHQWPLTTTIYASDDIT